MTRSFFSIFVRGYILSGPEDAVEVPVLIGLVKIELDFQRRYFAPQCGLKAIGPAVVSGGTE